MGLPAGEAVQLGGWDGIVEVPKGNAFVPDNTSVWEFTVNKNAKDKADGDYEKRTAEPLGIDPATSTFVFVTARRWADKREWEVARQKEGEWKDVRAYDADDLEAWLESAPSVHVWLSILLGKHPEGADDIANLWADWSGVTNPPLSAPLVLAGRTAIVESIQKWMAAPSSHLTLRGESREESLAVLAASIMALPAVQQLEILSRTVIAKDISAWNRLAASDNRIILIQDFESTTAIGRAAQRGHSAVLLLGRADATSPNAIEIPRIKAEDAKEAVLDMGVEKEKAGDLAVLARRSLMSLRRKLAMAPQIIQPQWAIPENSVSLIPALLLGRWSDSSEGDRTAISEIAAAQFTEVNKEFIRWMNDNDPPLRCVGSAWYLTSEEDAWSLLGRFVSNEHLSRFEKIVLQVLGDYDKRLDLAKDKRWYAELLGHKPQFSRLIHTGLANTLIMMGARGEGIPTVGSLSLSSAAAKYVRQLLEPTDWRIWASLPLRALAEAAPDEFLQAAERSLTGDSPPLAKLFEEEADEPMFGSSPHTELLWALEILAWSDTHLTRSALVLASLARIDPGGRLANRPLASLQGIFLPWYPQTGASPGQRLDAIDALRKREPEVAWKVMIRCLPKFHDVGHPSAKPQWREWAPEEPRVPRSEYTAAIKALVERLIDDASNHGRRWADLIESLPQLPPSDHDVVKSNLDALDSNELPQEEATTIWHALRILISNHRSFSDADWALPKAKVDALEGTLNRFTPANEIDRVAWLFSDRPMLLEGREEDWRAHETLVAERQDSALRSLIATRNPDWLRDLLRQTPRPALVGASLARTGIIDNIENSLLGEYLTQDDDTSRLFIAGFIGKATHTRGFQWAREKLEIAGVNWSCQQKAAFCTLLNVTDEALNLVESLTEECQDYYWKKVNVFFVEEPLTEKVVESLLRYGRPDAALQMFAFHSQRQALAPDLIVRALEQMLQAKDLNQARIRLSGHEIGDLLRIATDSGKVDEPRIARLEWAYLPALDRHSYQPRLLHRELSRNPEFFAQVVAIVFREEGADGIETSDEEQERARRGYELLDSWRSPPGLGADDKLDSSDLRLWVTKARELLKTSKRLAVGDVSIGQVLSGHFFGSDGAWPHEAVRNLIEELASDQFESGLVTGLFNSEGVYSKDPNDGGRRERGIAERYEAFATKVTSKWPRTAAMLRRIRDHYLAHAMDEDRRAELRQDLSD
ncbi:MAG: hypothetical protein DCC65_10630 [Planctomycetota bacterium]|nr:MAG: hypothetical protein DCC65_10630 [Planctomycetota bacterium]